MAVIAQGGFTIFFSFVIGLMLTILPLPSGLEPFRPDWMTMILIYWIMALPERVGVVTGWLVGLMVDVATGAILGQHALAMSAVAYITIYLHQRIRVYPLAQQAFSIVMLVALHQMIVLWILGIIGHPPESWLYWMSSLTSMLFWPLIFVVLRGIRRQYGVR